MEIIAEIGLNHDGSLNRALDMAESLKAQGATILKTQTSIPEQEATSRAMLNGERQIDMIRRLTLSFEDTKKLARHCEDIGLEFMSAPADPISLKFLIDECGVNRIKVGSDNLNNPLVLQPAAQSRKPVILSTGMADLGRIRQA